MSNPYMTEFSPDNDSHVYQIKDKEAAPITLLNDTVGWTGKNLIDKTQFKRYTDNEITTTQIANGIRVVVETAATYRYIYLTIKNPRKNTDFIFSDIATITSGYTLLRVDGSNDGTSFTKIKEGTGTSTSADQSITFNSGNYEYLQLKIYVTGGEATTADISFTDMMLRDASISDSTYEPHHESVEQTLRDAEVIEGKNKLYIPNQSRTLNGVTLKAIGGILYFSGTNTSSSGTWPPMRGINIPKGHYVFSVKGMTTNANQVEIKTSDETTTLAHVDTNNPSVAITVDSDWNDVCILARAASNANVDGIVLYPMLCTKEEWDKSRDFEPYYIPLKDSKFDRAEQRVLGAKNLIPFPYNVNLPITDSGITFTLNSDHSITANGTCTEGSYPTLNDIISAEKLNSLITQHGKIVLSGCPQNGGNNTYQIFVRSSSKDYIFQRGDDVILDTADMVKGVCIQIRSGYTANNLVFKPMLRLASDPDSTYQPYAMTNRELTEMMAVQESEVGSIASGASVGSDVGNHLVKTGKIVTLDIRLTSVSKGEWGDIGIIPLGFRPKYRLNVKDWAGHSMAIKTDGAIQCASTLSNAEVCIHATWITS